VTFIWGCCGVGAIVPTAYKVWLEGTDQMSNLEEGGKEGLEPPSLSALAPNVNAG
jgi:hypothetical protein